MPSNDNKNIKFTGDPVAFDGVEGKRDPKTGKGRFDLIPTEVYYPLFSKADHDWLLDCHPASILMTIANEKFIDAIIKMTIYTYSEHMEDWAASSSEFWHGVWPMLQDLAIHFQKGAEHYGERNCQKGIPLWSFKDSAMRHATQVFEGKMDEPHAISVIWNCWMAQWTVMQEKEKVSEEKFKCILNAAEANVNNALGDSLKDAVTNLREVRKKLRAEAHKYAGDPARYDVLSHSVEGLKYVINMLYSIAETNVALKCDQGEYILPMWDKLIDEKNAKEAGIPWPPKEPEIIPEARDDYRHTMLCRCPTDALVKELYNRLSAIDRSEKIVKQNFIANFQETMAKITQRYDAIKRGATGPIEIPKTTLQSDLFHTKDFIPFPKSWEQEKEVGSERTVDTVAIQQIISNLREELEKAHDVFTDANGKGVHVFFNHLRPVMNDMLAMWNSITPMLLDEKTPE